MSRIAFFIALLIIASFSLSAQHTIVVDAKINSENHSIEITQQIVYHNASNDYLTEIYLNDWANSFSSKTTPLAQRFSENFKSAFHFELDENRGRTDISEINNTTGSLLKWTRGDELDILKLELATPLAPGESQTFQLKYTVKLPDDRFTRFGVTSEGNYKLKHWLITPSVYKEGWKFYSNKNTDDYFQLPTNFEITLNYPDEYELFTDLNVVYETTLQNKKVIHLQGENRISNAFYFEKNPTFQSIQTDKLEVVTNLSDKKVSATSRAIIVDRILGYLQNRLGNYPHEKLLVSETDYRLSPVYGLNQLPDFVSPFPNGFEFDMELLKTISRKYLSTTLNVNPREDHWLIGAFQIYFLTDYVDTYYPNMKIMGTVSNFPILSMSHASEVKFNDQYPFLYFNMARNNLHQSLSKPRDSLLKFNKNIASDYYAGDGLHYLKDYLGDQSLEKSIKEFYQTHILKPVSPLDFKETLSKNTDLPIDWFFEDYVGKRTTIDFKIKKLKKTKDSLEVTILNKRDNKMPVSIYGLNKDEILFKKWLDPIDTTAIVTLPRANVRKLVLNYEGVIPEFNQRNNTKTVDGLLNRPIQFRLFKDVEDPKYNQLFFMPIFEYNLYDGFTMGPKLYNKTFLPKGVHYKVEPQYGFRSKKIIGKGSISYTQRVDIDNLYSMRYGISGSLFSYNRGLFYRKVTPYMTFAFRDNNDLRKNKKEFINIRNVNVFRDEDPNDPDQEPNYSVFDFKYVYSDKNLINYYRGFFDYQISQKFSKVSTQFEYRKLFNSNRQLDLRFYAGAFIFNDTGSDSNFFSFALDRPTDYLFDYNYYGRSEDTGLFSQQLVIAEGGFKSQLEPAFANQFIATLNGSTNIWKWIYAYGDIGVVKNKGASMKGVFDTGIRANLVADYFEIYLPLYSNLGWEPGLPNYDQKIRFIVTLDIKTMLGLFTREWY